MVDYKGGGGGISSSNGSSGSGDAVSTQNEIEERSLCPSSYSYKISNNCTKDTSRLLFNNYNSSYFTPSKLSLKSALGGE